MDSVFSDAGIDGALEVPPWLREFWLLASLHSMCLAGPVSTGIRLSSFCLGNLVAEQALFLELAPPLGLIDMRVQRPSILTIDHRITM